MSKTIGLLLGIVLLGVPGAAASDIRFPQIAGWWGAAIHMIPTGEQQV